MEKETANRFLSERVNNLKDFNTSINMAGSNLKLKLYKNCIQDRYLYR